jgi:hypothetical protein
VAAEAGARDADLINLPRRNSPIDIDRNLSAGLHLARVSRARIIIRICTDTKINAVVNPLGLLIARKNAR